MADLKLEGTYSMILLVLCISFIFYMIAILIYKSNKGKNITVEVVSALVVGFLTIITLNPIKIGFTILFVVGFFNVIYLWVISLSKSKHTNTNDKILSIVTAAYASLIFIMIAVNLYYAK